MQNIQAIISIQNCNKNIVKYYNYKRKKPKRYNKNRHSLLSLVQFGETDAFLTNNSGKNHFFHFSYRK